MFFVFLKQQELYYYTYKRFFSYIQKPAFLELQEVYC